MKVIRKVLKWFSLVLIALIVLVIAAGLCYRLAIPAPHGPMGKLVDIGGYQLHIHSTGEQSDKPTLVIEGGAGLSSGFYHWLSEGCKDSMRVVRYDRAGLGYSDVSDTPRDPETIAQELHTLLEYSGEAPPYILAAHSLGGSYIRVFAELYPDEVSGMILIDATHPDRVERMNLPLASSYTFKLIIGLTNTQAVLADMGILGLWDKLFGPILGREAEGLPQEINDRTIDFLANGKYLRAFAKEMSAYHPTLKRAGAAHDFGNIPIRVFTAVARHKKHEDALKSKGIDPDERHNNSVQMQREYTELSTDGKQILIDANHSTIFTIKENADIICKEIIQISRDRSTTH